MSISSSSTCWCRTRSASLLAAMLSMPQLPGRTFYRTAIFMPTMLSFVIIGFTWKLILSPIWGVSPTLLGAVGLQVAVRAVARQGRIRADGLVADLGLAVCRHPDDADLCRAAVDPRRGDRGRRTRRRHRPGAVLEDQAAADPAVDRHHLDPDLRRQFQRLRPDLHRAGRARRAELLRPTSWAPSSTAPSSASSSRSATRTWARRSPR